MRNKFIFRPLEIPSIPKERKSSQFSATYGDTLEILDKELSFLDARMIVLQVDLEENQIRNDGIPYAKSKPKSPAVVLSFDSKFGQLSYPCDKFLNWEDNLRAIALSLEALRKVDRYGVTKRAEQYRGWQALPSPEDIKEQSKKIILAHSSAQEVSKKAVTEAIKKTHPDMGGNSDEFRKVISAKENLGL